MAEYSGAGLRESQAAPRVCCCAEVSPGLREGKNWVPLLDYFEKEYKGRKYVGEEECMVQYHAAEEHVSDWP